MQRFVQLTDTKLLFNIITIKKMQIKNMTRTPTHVLD
jgi:hypothetical protein